MTTNIEDKKFDDNYKFLPEEVKFYMSSDLSGKIILDLAKDYKIDPEVVYSFVYFIVNSNFNFSLLEERIKNLNLSGTSLTKLHQDFIGRFLSPIASIIKKESAGRISIINELRRVGAKEEDYRSFVKELEDEFEEEVLRIVEEEANEYKESFELEEERPYILDLLSHDLISIFDCNSFEAAAGLNRGIIYLLFNEDSFKEEALRKILNNKELIGKNKVHVEDKQYDSSVSFWLKDFIKTHGSGMFDDLALAQYLNNSSKTKMLDAQEKSLLGKIINFYKNIAFFPESFSELPPGHWKMFYFDSSEFEKEIEDLLKGGSKDNLAKKEDKINTFNDTLEDDSLKTSNTLKKEEGALKDEAESDELKKLRNMLSNYPPSSLERKAIQGEIKKLLKK